MSTQTFLPYLEIFPNMALADIAKIDDLPRRALALFYSEALDPANPNAVALARSVDVPEAGTWGHNVQVRLTELEGQKPKRKRYRTPPELRPNLFMIFDNEAAKLKATAGAENVVPNGNDPSQTASSRGVEK